MSLILDTVFLRWYRSFNTQSDERKSEARWEKLDGECFQFVEVDIDRQITTVVGANESGKSHLLSAICKVLSPQQAFTSADVCRHCAYDALEAVAVPQIGIRLRSGSDSTTLDTLLRKLGVESSTRSVVVILQPENKPFAAVYDDAEDLVKELKRDEWYSISKELLPAVELIQPDVKFGSLIHISQLIAAYRDSEGSNLQFFDTMPLNEVGRDIIAMDLPEVPEANQDAPFPEQLVEDVAAAQRKLHDNLISAGRDARLERDLFEDILEVPKPKLQQIQTLVQRNRGYVELLVSDINQRIRQRLDLSNYWSQDEDISLGVNYKDGFFYFEIHDKTGKAFTFDERSSGLQYFLSYYVQSLAIKKRNSHQGCVVLMDEPDRFLSAVAQRNLLQVFDMLSTPQASNPLQLIYTTHSPFSINRNFPSRLRLVRKGDGSEGTQLVEKSASRSYEPVRTALGVEAGDTLFFGMNNVVVEGFSDQRAIIAGAQLCAANPKRNILDLNKVVFLTANGVGKLKALIEKAKTDDERKPVTVALLDGDTTGRQKLEEVKEEELLPHGSYCSYKDLGITLKTPDKEQRVAEVLEDLLPVGLLSEAVIRYLKGVWKKSDKELKQVPSLVAIDKDKNLAEVIVAAIHALEPRAKHVSKVHLKGEVVDLAIDELLQHDDFKAERQQFEERFEKVIDRLNEQLQVAERDYRQANIRKQFRVLIDPFLKRYGQQATRFDILNLLRDLSTVVTGISADAKKTRDQLAQLEELLDKDTILGSDPVDAELWKSRLLELWHNPWAAPKKDWENVKPRKGRKQESQSETNA